VGALQEREQVLCTPSASVTQRPPLHSVSAVQGEPKGRNWTTLTVALAEPTWPAWSIASTSISCGPTGWPFTGKVKGGALLVPIAFPSTNSVTCLSLPLSCTSAWTSKLAETSAAGAGLRIVTSGGSVSTYPPLYRSPWAFCSIQP
jgi:hypothetical protein